MDFIQARWKAVAALLGVVLSFLYYYQTTNPNSWVSAAIAALTVLGVHQVNNQGSSE